MRAALAILVCCFGCDGGSRAAPPPLVLAAAPVEVMLVPGAGLPRFDIQASFASDVDPKPHVQPITSALAGARAACATKPGLAATLSVEVRDRRVHASAHNATATCLARAMDGLAIDDAGDYAVELRISVG
jgi:hypothetical protein